MAKLTEGAGSEILHLAGIMARRPMTTLIDFGKNNLHVCGAL